MKKLGNLLVSLTLLVILSLSSCTKAGPETSQNIKYTAIVKFKVAEQTNTSHYTVLASTDNLLWSEVGVAFPTNAPEATYTVPVDVTRFFNSSESSPVIYLKLRSTNDNADELYSPTVKLLKY